MISAKVARHAAIINRAIYSPSNLSRQLFSQRRDAFSSESEGRKILEGFVGKSAVRRQDSGLEWIEIYIDTVR
jgi:hypothetical protein